MELNRPLEVDEIARASNLDRCTGCHRCTRVCPASEHGGVVPHQVVAETQEGTVDLSQDSMIWKCLMCNICSHVCPVRINPSYLITLLRNASAERGHAPKRYMEARSMVRSSGRSFPNTRLTSKMRGELGLPPLNDDQEAVDELLMLWSTTPMGDDGDE